MCQPLQAPNVVPPLLYRTTDEPKAFKGFSDAGSLDAAALWAACKKHHEHEPHNGSCETQRTTQQPPCRRSCCIMRRQGDIPGTHAVVQHVGARR